MSYYHSCPDCKANLDPGERCDCKNVKQPVSDRLIIAYDNAENGDIPVFTVARKIGGTIYIINWYKGDEAIDMYNKLIIEAPENKIKLL